MKSIKAKQSTEHSQAKSNARLGIMWQLEPRMMFDGAAAYASSEVLEEIVSQSDFQVNSQDWVARDSQLPISEASNIQNNNRDELSLLADYKLPHNPSQEVVFVDTRVKDYQTLLSNIHSNIDYISSSKVYI